MRGGLVDAWSDRLGCPRGSHGRCGRVAPELGAGVSTVLAEEVLVNHVRSRMLDHPSNVVSSDPHAMKPSCNGRPADPHLIPGTAPSPSR